MNKQAFGFTLIELLVVIAIIGTLSSIIISSLGTARSKGADTAVKQQLSDMRTAAEAVYDQTGNYLTVCDSMTNSGALFRSALASSNKQSASSLCTTNGATYYSVDAGGNLVSSGKAAVGTPLWRATLKLSTGQYFCVNSSGEATTTASVQGNTNITAC